MRSEGEFIYHAELAKLWIALRITSQEDAHGKNVFELVVERITALEVENADLKAKLEVMERIGDAGREVYDDWMSGKDADELTASWPALIELHEALAAA